MRRSSLRGGEFNADEASQCKAFYVVILFAGSLSGYPMTDYTLELLQQIFLWPFYFARWVFWVYFN